jgi:hypothetical protein
MKRAMAAMTHAEKQPPRRWKSEGKLRIHHATSVSSAYMPAARHMHGCKFTPSTPLACACQSPAPPVTPASRGPHYQKCLHDGLKYAFVMSRFAAELNAGVFSITD